MRVHQRGEVNLNGGREAKIEGVDVELLMNRTDRFKPVMEPDFIRKYVAYSKRFNPLMTDDVLEAIVKKYVEIRNDSRDSALPITARQLEGYIRLAEASARMRFSNKVEMVDAERAIRLVTYYLTKMASDSNGNMDYSLISGMSTEKIRNNEFAEGVVTKIIKAGSSTSPMTIDDIIKAAMIEGVEEDDVRRIVRRMHERGSLYSPRSDLYKFTA